MSRVKFVCWAVSLVFFSCTTAEFGCRRIDVNGMVYDFENRPVVGYLVALGERTASTDVTGRFTLADVSPGPYGMRGRKDGFESYEGSVDVRDDRQIVYIRIPSTRQLLDLADIALSVGDFTKASAIIERAERSDGLSFDCRFYRAVAQFRKDNPVAARETLRAMIADGCDDPYVAKFLESIGGGI